VEFVRQKHGDMVTVWEAVIGVVREIAPGTRADTRRLRVALLCDLHRLLRRGLLRRENRDFLQVVEPPLAASAPTANTIPQELAQQVRSRIFRC
jgi:hypothetical protein